MISKKSSNKANHAETKTLRSFVTTVLVLVFAALGATRSEFGGFEK
jgi:hypothetical protein